MLSLYSSLSSAKSGLKSIVKSGLQLFYKVNVTSGSVLDRSRNSNNGTVYSGKALEFDRFDGSNDFIELNDANLTGEFTVCTWVEPHSHTQCNIFGDTANQNWIRIHSASSITVKIAGLSTDYVELTHGGNIALNEWSRVVVTRGSDNIIRFGINGVFYSPSTTARAGNFNFNRLGVKDNLEMNGALADVQVYDKAWTASDVEFDYNNPDKDVFNNPNSSIVVTDCKSLLRLNEGAGDRVYDAAPVLGAEEVVNGDYSNGLTGWSTQIPNGQVVEVVNNQLHIDYDASETQGSTGANQTILVANKTYQIEVDIESITGTIRIQAGGVVNDFNTAGVKTFTVVPSSTILHIIRSSNGNNVDVVINNISVKEIKPAESFFITGDKNFLHQQPHIPQYAMSSFSKKMLFTDVDTDVDIGAQSIADDQAFSFSFWYAQADDSNLENYILAKHDSTDDYIRFNNQNESLEFRVNGGTAITYDISDLTDFKTSHIVLTRASGANPITKCYVNSFLEVTDTSSNADGVFEYQQIGAGGTSNAGTFFLDELAHFSKELSLIEVKEIFNAGIALDVRNHSALSDLEGYWRNNGADTWTDLSTNSNNGTVNGSPTEIFLQEVPFFGKDSLGMFMNKPRLGGLNFNSSGYVDTGDPFQSTFRDSFSICFWFKFPDGQPSSAMRFFGHDVGEDELFISLETDGKSTLQFRSNNDIVTSKTDAAIASNNQTDWIYSTVTVTKASTIGDAQIIFYKDGSVVNSSLVGSDTLTQSNMEAYTQTQNIVLGAFNNDGTIANFCDGIIDDFKIYSKALTAAEVTKNYKEGKGRHKN